MTTRWRNPTEPPRGGSTSSGIVDLGDVDLTGLAAGDTLVWDAGLGLWFPSAPGGGGSTDPVDLLAQLQTLPRALFWMYDDFTGFPGLNTAGGGQMLRTQLGTGAAVTTAAAPDVTAVGMVRLTTGSTTTGQAGIEGAMPTGLRLGGGAWFLEGRLWLPALSTGTQTFGVVFGFTDTPDQILPGDGVYFIYTTNGTTGVSPSVNWQCVTCDSSSGTRTVTDTGVAVVANSFDRLTIQITADGSEAVFSIDGVLEATHTTNLPLDSTEHVGFGAVMKKSAGTSGSDLWIDYINATCHLTTPR